MSSKQGPGKGGRRKIGRWKRKPCNLRYAAENRHDKHKMKRILQSSGEVAVKEWEHQRYMRGKDGI